jgi:hypothetical protein
MPTIIIVHQRCVGRIILLEDFYPLITATGRNFTHNLLIPAA